MYLLKVKARFGVIFLFSCPLAWSAPPQFRIETSIGALRIPASDLGVLIGKVEHLSRSSAGIAPDSQRGELALSDGVRTFQVSGDYSARSLEAAPKKSTEVSYSFYNAESAISQVSIELGNFDRTITVKGMDEARVESLAEFISAELRKHETYATGEWPRLGLALLSALLVVVAWRGGLVPAPLAFLIVGFVSFFLGSATSILPGTVIYQGELSFLVRYTPHFTFASLLLGVWVTARPWLRRRRSRSEARDGSPAA